MLNNILHLHIKMQKYQFKYPDVLSKGPLHTHAKSHDHEIVRASKKVSKGRPKTPPKSCSVVIDPEV